MLVIRVLLGSHPCPGPRLHGRNMVVVVERAPVGREREKKEKRTKKGHYRSVGKATYHRSRTHMLINELLRAIRARNRLWTCWSCGTWLSWMEILLLGV